MFVTVGATHSKQLLQSAQSIIHVSRPGSALAATRPPLWLYSTLTTRLPFAFVSSRLYVENFGRHLRGSLHAITNGVAYPAWLAVRPLTYQHPAHEISFRLDRNALPRKQQQHPELCAAPEARWRANVPAPKILPRVIRTWSYPSFPACGPESQRAVMRTDGNLLAVRPEHQRASM